MPIDPSIAMGYRGLGELPNPMNQMAQIAQLQHSMGQNELAKYQLSAAQRADQTQNAISRAYQESIGPDGTLDYNKLQSRLAAGGAGSSIPELQNKRLTAENLAARTEASKATTNKTNFELTNLKIDRARTTIAAARNPEEALAAINKNLAAGNIDAEDAGILKKDLNDSATFAEGKARVLQTMLSAKDQLAQQAVTYKDTDMGGYISRQNFNAQGPVGDPIKLPKTAAPSTEAALMSARAAGERNQIARARLANETATGKFTPDTIDFLAQTYIQTGNIPPLGMGRAAADLRQKVIERAAIAARTPATAAPGETAPTPISAADAARTIGQNKQAFAGGMAGQRTLGTTLANVTSAATEANNMIPLVEKYAALVNPTDFPLVNAAGNFVSRQGGGENVVGLAGSLNSLVNAYARAINPKGVATVSDKNHAREIINEAMSKGQLNTALSVMRAEMESAMAAPVQVQERMRGGGKSQAPAAAATTPAAVYVETKPLPDGRVLGKKADGSVEVIK